MSAVHCVNAEDEDEVEEELERLDPFLEPRLRVDVADGDAVVVGRARAVQASPKSMSWPWVMSSTA